MTTPPPPPPSDPPSGPAPGSDLPGQQPFQPPQPGQAPGGPADQAGPGSPQPGAPQGAAPGKPKMSKPVLYALIAALVVVVGGAIIFGVISSQDEVTNAEAGDCIQVIDEAAGDFSIVECGSGDADFEVLDVIDGISQQGSLCPAETVSYLTITGDEASSLCLGPVE